LYFSTCDVMVFNATLSWWFSICFIITIVWFSIMGIYHWERRIEKNSKNLEAICKLIMRLGSNFPQNNAPVETLDTYYYLLFILGNYPSNVVKASKRDMNTLVDEMTSYLTKCYSKINDEEHNHKKRATVPPLSDALAAARSQCVTYASLVIQGLFDPDEPMAKLPHSPLLKTLLDQSLPHGFLIDLISVTTSHSWQEFKDVFTSLLQCLVMDGRSSSIVDATYRPSLTALTELSDIKIGGNNRPICQLLTEMV
jgi:hypothetical protein